jgi:hypothetical protein
MDQNQGFLMVFVFFCVKIDPEQHEPEKRNLLERGMGRSFPSSPPHHSMRLKKT